MIAPAIERAESAKAWETSVRRAEAIFRETIAPALDTANAGAAQSLRSKAKDFAGVWALPDGDAYYAAALQSNTTTSIAAGELHREACNSSPTSRRNSIKACSNKD